MFALANTLAAAGFVPARINLELAMLDACRAAGASAWYVPDDFVTLGPELVGVSSASVAGTSGYFYTDFSPVVGKSYQITYQYSVTGGTSVQMSLGGSNVPSSTVGSGTVVFVISATNNNPLRCYSNAATATLSGISVKEVISAKDFQDSAGTLPSYLGGTVGLGLDSAGTVGAELIPTYDFTSGSWSVIGTPSGVTPNGFTNESGTTAGLVIAAASVGLVQGKTYRISIPYSKSESASSLSVRIAGTDVASASASSGVITGVATAGSTGLQLRYANNGTVTFGAISVKEITGNHVTQATAGNRPLVSRIPRKLGPELVTNGTFDADASWTKGTGWSISGGLATKAVGVAANLDQVVNLSGKNVTVSFTVSGRTAGTVSALLVESGVGASTLGSASANGSFTFVGVRPTTGVFRINSDSVFDGSIDNISVREVLEWSNALTFDGSNDSLATPASIIGTNLSLPYTMITWGKVGALVTGRIMQGDSARYLGYSSAAKPVITHSGTVGRLGSTTLQQGQVIVLEATYDGSAISLWVNGAKEVDQVATGAPSTAATAHTIGQAGGNAAYFNDQLGGVVVCPAVMTEAQRLAVRKFAAAQMGLTL